MTKANGEDDGSNSMDRISELPKDLVQRILYFLSQEDAARTSVLSKSWRYVWCTRPNLDLTDTTFKGDKQRFLSTVDKVLQRYCDQSLRLEKFRLTMTLGCFDGRSVSLLDKWIPTLTNMGMKEFRLSINSKKSPRRRRVRLPPVVFEAASLQDLRMERLMLDRKTIEKTILFKHLKRLDLEEVNIDDAIFQKMTSSCPLIETLFLKSCKRLRNISMNNLRHLKNFSFSCFSIDDEDCTIEIYPPSIETIKIEYAILLFQKGADFRNLHYLFLFHVLFSSAHFSSCKFPSLEDLALLYCDGLEEPIEESQLFIDAPNIKSFVYHHGMLFLPSISFATTSSDWRSSLFLLSRDSPSLWLLKLHKLLESLSQSSGISLSITQSGMTDEDISQENLQLVQDIKDNIGNKPAVVLEKLKISQFDSSHFSPLSNVLFCICRPRNIGEVNYMDSESVLKNLMQREGAKQDQLRQLWLPDLEEVCLEIYDKNQREWRSTSLSDLPEYEQGKFFFTRFPLKWRQNL